jgi:hypothetical protein
MRPDQPPRRTAGLTNHYCRELVGYVENSPDSFFCRHILYAESNQGVREQTYEKEVVLAAAVGQTGRREEAVVRRRSLDHLKIKPTWIITSVAEMDPHCFPIPDSQNFV